MEKQGLVIWCILLLSSIFLALGILYDIKTLAYIGVVLYFSVTPVGIYFLLKSAKACTK